MLQVALLNEPPQMPADQSGRLELAKWIVSPSNPLTARVYVNRAWHYLFGAGLVRTLDNFGTTGETPSHPELLDDLASRFAAGGWSTKSLVREIVLSHAYRMSTQHNDQAATVDPENRLLARMNRRRLDAESLRDAILMTAGTLDLTVGGRNIADETLAKSSAITPAEYGFVFTDMRAHAQQRVRHGASEVRRETRAERRRPHRRPANRTSLPRNPRPQADRE
jgi:hypothetical protein